MGEAGRISSSILGTKYSTNLIPNVLLFTKEKTFKDAIFYMTTPNPLSTKPTQNTVTVLSMVRSFTSLFLNPIHPSISIMISFFKKYDDLTNSSHCNSTLRFTSSSPAPGKLQTGAPPTPLHAHTPSSQRRSRLEFFFSTLTNKTVLHIHYQNYLIMK